MQRRVVRLILVLALVTLFLAPQQILAIQAANVLPQGATVTATPVYYYPYYAAPTTSIVSVTKDVSVTLQTYNFPPNQTFTVTMGAYGTLGIGGVVVASTPSGAGGSFQVTYTIPDALKGSERIAVRMQSAQGFYAYDWFFNVVSGTPVPGTGGPYNYYYYPTTSIVTVVKDTSVTLQTYNFPPNQNFTVTIGAFGTLGVGGIVVATTPSGAGGSFQVTYTIPDALKGSNQLAIRLQSASGFYAYDWFYNVNSGTPTPGVILTPGTGGPYYYYYYYPTTSIVSVNPGVSVTLQTYNFPPNQNFTVTMGAFGTLGIGGVVVATTPSGAGGSFQVTYNIPAALASYPQIAIRLQSPQGYYAYDWFNNTTGGVVPTTVGATPTRTPTPASSTIVAPYTATPTP